jgi:hypothetical protein
VVSFAIGAHEGDAGAMLESVVMLARREIPWTPPKPAAAQAATARENALPIAVVDLPCGPGAFTESLVELTAEADSRAMAEMVSFDNPLPEEFESRIPESEVVASVRAVFG